MTRIEIEQKLWADQYHWGMVESEDRPIACEVADAAVEQFRQRYPVEPAAPDATWYDEPPFAKDGESYPCWVRGEEYPCATHWSHYARAPRWVYCHTEDKKLVPLAGRPVYPIIKPQEPTT